MDKKKARGFVAILVLMVLVVIVIMIWKDFLKSKTPEIEQLKNDFWNEKLNPDVYSISKFEVETETDGKEDTYKAIVCVAYDNATVEYVRRYHYTYNKYDEWVLGTIEDYEEEIIIERNASREVPQKRGTLLYYQIRYPVKSLIAMAASLGIRDEDNRIYMEQKGWVVSCYEEPDTDNGDSDADVNESAL